MTTQLVLGWIQFISIHFCTFRPQSEQ